MPNKQEVPYQPNNKTNLGEINITTGVLETIASKAASEVAGVSSQATNFLGRNQGSLATTVSRENGILSVDIHIRVKYGYSVPEVALAVQDAVKEQILFMTDLVINQVNVHVESIEPEASLEGDNQ
ncbi:Asp23/Gls24 family envelope stress response protein [Hutsoniella sourekii]|uniref:Asp23/Gls24 family envelope stress response protein n=1 Tax=Hutsoniella sourekii TaxID=87650 RepID=UPI0004807085|nr:Asp23/Gls24 family envelope stress response protein [Hutsoniella sourekii]